MTFPTAMFATAPSAPQRPPRTISAKIDDMPPIAPPRGPSTDDARALTESVSPPIASLLSFASFLNASLVALTPEQRQPEMRPPEERRPQICYNSLMKFRPPVEDPVSDGTIVVGVLIWAVILLIIILALTGEI